MRILASFLILLLCISDKAQSLSCDGAFSKLFQLTGAIASEIPVAATFLNTFNFLISNGCTSESSKDIAKEEDRYQEVRQSECVLNEHIKTLNEIRSYSDVNTSFAKYETLRTIIRTWRANFFGPDEHFHENHFKLFTEWANVELSLLEIMIQAKKYTKNQNVPNYQIDPSDQNDPIASISDLIQAHFIIDYGKPKNDYEAYSQYYGNTLLFYIRKGSEMLTRWPLELAHSSEWERLYRVKTKAAYDLRPTIVMWIEAVETKSEVRRRLRHKGIAIQPSDDWTQWDDLLGWEDRQYLPLKISDGDWISMKLTVTHRRTYGGSSNFIPNSGDSSWLSCKNSIAEEDYCTYRKCPALDGNQGANECKGERFQIQSTAHGPIEFGEKIAFKYWDWDCSEGRGHGTYWLSKRSEPNRDRPAKLYTMPCPGGSFTKNDLDRCDSETFTLKRGPKNSYASYNYPSYPYAKYLRNGDLVNINEIFSSSFHYEGIAFIMRAYRQTGDKNYC